MLQNEGKGKKEEKIMFFKTFKCLSVGVILTAILVYANKGGLKYILALPPIWQKVVMGAILVIIFLYINYMVSCTK